MAAELAGDGGPYAELMAALEVGAAALEPPQP